jgi:hypothetical protein
VGYSCLPSFCTQLQRRKRKKFQIDVDSLEAAKVLCRQRPGSEDDWETDLELWRGLLVEGKISPECVPARLSEGLFGWLADSGCTRRFLAWFSQVKTLVACDIILYAFNALFCVIDPILLCCASQCSCQKKSLTAISSTLQLD